MGKENRTHYFVFCKSDNSSRTLAPPLQKKRTCPTQPRLLLSHRPLPSLRSTEQAARAGGAEELRAGRQAGSSQCLRMSRSSLMSFRGQLTNTDLRVTSGQLEVAREKSLLVWVLGKCAVSVSYLYMLEATGV